MRLLVVDPWGDGLDVAVRAQADGHDVRYFVRASEENKNVGVGFVERVEDFRPWIIWADVVFAVDNTLYVRDLSNARRAGHRGIICPSETTTEWETNRSAGQAVFKRAGIDTLPFREFHDYDAAIKFVKKHDRRFVSKPSDEADKALSYVAKSPEDLVYMLERWKKLGKLKAPFILQDFVSGCEMAVGAFYGPGGFSLWCENWEFKKLMNNDLGVATGEQGTILRFVSASKLAKKVLAPLERMLAQENYVGYIDVNCIIDDAGEPWPLEFTCRPGWPTYNIQLALCKGDSAQWLLDLTKGKNTDIWIRNRLAAGVVLSIPDYPYSNFTKKEVNGIPIYGIKPSLWKHVHMAEMMLAEDVPIRAKDQIVNGPCPATAGDYVLIMTATADTVRDATNACYRRLELLNVPNSPMYRTDIGRRLAKQLPKIQSQGYATSMLYSMPLAG
jgi:phosphoribosylamine---glycine ligase